MIDEMEKLRLDLVCLAQNEVLKKRCNKAQLELCLAILSCEAYFYNRYVNQFNIKELM